MCVYRCISYVYCIIQSSSRSFSFYVEILQSMGEFFQELYGPSYFQWVPRTKKIRKLAAILPSWEIIRVSANANRGVQMKAPGNRNTYGHLRGKLGYLRADQAAWARVVEAGKVQKDREQSEEKIGRSQKVDADKRRKDYIPACISPVPHRNRTEPNRTEPKTN